jgi:undecaprenol kinase
LGQPAFHENKTSSSTPGAPGGGTPAPDALPAPARAAFLSSFRYAWRGLVYVVRSQRNMRVHLGAGLLVLVLAALLRLPPLAWAVLLLCITIVAVMEMLNTVVEATVDLATDRYHPLAKIAKDTAAGAVLVAAIGAALVGLLVLGPPLWHAVFR